MDAATVDAIVSQALKEMMQRAGFELQNAIEAHVDERGPAKGKRSTSHQWGKQTGRANRSLIPGQPENVTRITGANGRVNYDFGSKVFYLPFLEHGTSRMIARPSVGPGFADYVRDGWPRLVQMTLNEIIRRLS